MLRDFHTTGFFIELAIVVIIYATASYFVEISLLIQILNGLFAGIFVAIIPTHGRVLWNSILQSNPYDREHQYSLSVGLLWISVIINRMLSIYVRATSPPGYIQNNDSQFLGVAIYIAIIAGILQITALSQYEGAMRDTKFLVTCSIIGASVAIIVILLQIYGESMLL